LSFKPVGSFLESFRLTKNVVFIFKIVKPKLA